MSTTAKEIQTYLTCLLMHLQESGPFIGLDLVVTGIIAPAFMDPTVVASVVLVALALVPRVVLAALTLISLVVLVALAPPVLIPEQVSYTYVHYIR